MAFFSRFRQNRAPRRPYKAPQNLKSRGTALFITFCHRGSSEPTEAFCLWFRAKFGLKTSKNGHFGAIFRVLGSNSDIFLFFTVILSQNHMLIKLLLNNSKSIYSICYSQGWPIYEPSISHLAQIWAKMPIFLWKSGPHLGHWFICGPHSQKTYRIDTTPVIPK